MNIFVFMIIIHHFDPIYISLPTLSLLSYFSLLWFFLYIVNSIKLLAHTSFSWRFFYLHDNIQMPNQKKDWLTQLDWDRFCLFFFFLSVWLYFSFHIFFIIVNNHFLSSLFFKSLSSSIFYVKLMIFCSKYTKHTHTHIYYCDQKTPMIFNQ